MSSGLIDEPGSTLTFFFNLSICSEVRVGVEISSLSLITFRSCVVLCLN